IVVNGGSVQFIPRFDQTNLTQFPLISTNLPAFVDSNITMQGNILIQTDIGNNNSTSLTLNGNIGQDATPRSITLSPQGSNTNQVTTAILSGNNTFTGGVTIGGAGTAGTGSGVVLQMGSAGALNSSGANKIAFANGAASSLFVLRLNGF